jgi:hypothetical protein
MQSPELMESILKNQEQIAKLIESQNKLFRRSSSKKDKKNTPLQVR